MHKSNHNNVIKSMLMLATGASIGRLLSFISIPIITRIYSPEHMGILSVFIAMTAIITPLGTMRYSVAIPLPKSNANALNLVAACFFFLIVITFLFSVMLWLCPEEIYVLLSMENLITFWWLMPIVLFGVGLYEILNSWATRQKAFKNIAKTQISQSISGGLVKIILGFYGFKPLGLLIGHALSQVGGILILLRVFRESYTFNAISIRRILYVIKRYSDFPKYRLLSQFLLVFSVQAPLLFSNFIYGKEVAGQLSLALSTLAIPISIFGNTTSQVYYAEISKIGKDRPGDLFFITKKVIKKIFLISFPFFIVLFIFGKWLFETIFGEQWEMAGIFSQILSLYLMAQFISSPIVTVLNVFESQSKFLCINIIRFLIVISIFSFGYKYSIDYYKLIAIYSIVLSVFYYFTMISIINLLKLKVKNAKL